MGSKWPYASLGELAASEKNAISIGPFGSNMKTELYVDEGVPVIRGTNISGSRWLKGDWVHVSEEFARANPGYVAKPGDLVFPHRGAIGEVALVEEHHGPMVLSTSMMKFRPDQSNVDSLFLYYFFRSSQGRSEILRYSSQVGTPGIGQPLTSLRQFRVPLPEKNVQQAIGHILGSLDDKVELNRQMNRTLEQMAQTLFKSWFIDFDPVVYNAVQAGNPVPEEFEEAAGRYRENPGAAPVPQDILNRFPRCFADSEIGPVPKGWSHGTLGDVATNPRRGVKPAEIPPDTPYFGLEHLPRRSICLDSWGVAEKVSSSKTQFNKGEILFGKLRPYFHKVGMAPTDGICSTDILVIVPTGVSWQGFVLSLVSSKKFIDYTETHSAGTKMPRTNWKDMRDYSVALPPEGLAKIFQDCVFGFYEEIIDDIYQNQSLADLRDTLLPKLISGELRLKDSEIPSLGAEA